MKCLCCTLIISGNKLLVKCENCKNKSPKNNLDHFKWYEKHIIIIRDNPDKRLIIELIILFGYIGMLILCYLEKCNLTFEFNKSLRLTLAIIFTGWFGLVYGYIYSFQKLKKEEKFFLTLDYSE